MRLFLFVSCAALSAFVNAQETKEISQELTPGHKESFFVLLNDTTKKEGRYISTFRDARFCEGQYSGGERTGSWKFYNYPSEKLEYTYNYDLKQFEGPYTKYFENGRIELTVNYINGKREGEQQAYYPKGALLDSWVFKNDEANGKRSHYYEDGSLNSELNYVSGHLEGSAKFYHQNKQLLLEVLYKGGKLMNIAALNDSSGKALDPGTFKDGNGVRNIYFGDGTLRFTFEYQNGELNGRYMEYRNDKTLFVEGNFLHNEPSGIWKFLTDNRKEFGAYDFELDSMIRENKDLTSKMLNYEQKRMNDIRWMKKSMRKEREANPTIKESETPVLNLSNKKETFDNDLEVHLKITAGFPGGDKELMVYLQNNITYPVYEKENQIMGTIYIGFIVERDGSISEIKPIKTVKNGYGLTKEAMRVIALMPHWTPGMKDGLPVRVSCMVPIKFVLR